MISALMSFHFPTKSAGVCSESRISSRASSTAMTRGLVRFIKVVIRSPFNTWKQSRTEGHEISVGGMVLPNRKLSIDSTILRRSALDVTNTFDSLSKSSYPRSLSNDAHSSLVPMRCLNNSCFPPPADTGGVVWGCSFLQAAPGTARESEFPKRANHFNHMISTNRSLLQEPVCSFSVRQNFFAGIVRASNQGQNTRFVFGFQ